MGLLQERFTRSCTPEYVARRRALLSAVPPRGPSPECTGADGLPAREGWAYRRAMVTAALYRSVQRLLRALAPVLGPAVSKPARAIAARSASLARLLTWARKERDPARAAVWAPGQT